MFNIYIFNRKLNDLMVKKFEYNLKVENLKKFKAATELSTVTI